MAEDFETLAAVAANALDHNRQWATETIKQMVELHRETLEELRDTKLHLEASTAREEQERGAHRVTTADRDLNRSLFKSQAEQHTAEAWAHHETAAHRDRLASGLNEANKTINALEEALTTTKSLLAECKKNTKTLFGDLQIAEGKAISRSKALKMLPRKYGHIEGCDCNPCSFVRARA